VVRTYTFEGLFIAKALSKNDVMMVGSLSREGHPLSIVFVSDDPTHVHKAIRTMDGRNIRVTVEILG
jgi:hypothetical protein